MEETIQTTYDYITEPKEGWRKVASFTEAERNKLRQVAETLAMLDSNAFFGMTKNETTGDDTWYENYLPEAHALYEANGGDNGWAGESSINKKKVET